MKKTLTNILSIVETKWFEGQETEGKYLLPYATLLTCYTEANSVVIDVETEAPVCLPLFEEPAFDTIRGFSYNDTMCFIDSTGNIINLDSEKVSRMGWEYDGMTLYFKRHESGLNLIAMRRNRDEKQVNEEELEIEKAEILSWEA